MCAVISLNKSSIKLMFNQIFASWQLHRQVVAEEERVRVRDSYLFLIHVDRWCLSSSLLDNLIRVRQVLKLQTI